MNNKFTTIKCPKCNMGIRKNLLDKHLFQAHGLSNVKPEKNSQLEKDNQPSQESRWTTDDSGVVITIEQYAKNKGEIDKRDQRIKRLGNVTLNKKAEPQVNIFAEIANSPEPKPKPRPTYRGKKRSQKTKCQHCGAYLNVKNIKKHFQKVHPNEVPPLSASQNAKLQKKYSQKDRPQVAPEGQIGNMGEALLQAFNEKRDGSRDFAHYRRQSDGKFGSYPLHDDYSDESNAD